MKNQNLIRRLCLLVGLCVLVAGVVMVVAWQWGIQASRKQCQEYVQIIQQLVPQPQGAAPEQRQDNTMAALSVEGRDFVGILEMPLFDAALPVGADWGGTFKHPCRFGGSIYDGTMQIGATSQAGQFDFYREISVGDSVFFTDVEGNCYAYAVADVRHEKHADQAALQRHDADLTLFIKNIYGFEYIIVFCDAVR